MSLLKKLALPAALFLASSASQTQEIQALHNIYCPCQINQTFQAADDDIIYLMIPGQNNPVYPNRNEYQNMPGPGTLALLGFGMAITSSRARRKSQRDY